MKARGVTGSSSVPDVVGNKLISGFNQNQESLGVARLGGRIAMKVKRSLWLER